MPSHHLRSPGEWSGERGSATELGADPGPDCQLQSRAGTVTDWDRTSRRAGRCPREARMPSTRCDRSRTAASRPSPKRRGWSMAGIRASSEAFQFARACAGQRHANRGLRARASDRRRRRSRPRRGPSALQWQERPSGPAIRQIDGRSARATTQCGGASWPAWPAGGRSGRHGTTPRVVLLLDRLMVADERTGLITYTPRAWISIPLSKAP